jgi:hypothetical protein
MENIEYQIAHVSVGGGEMHPLPEHLMMKNN